MRILLCDRGSVLADFQDVLRGADPTFEVQIETDGFRAVERAYGLQPDVIVTEIDLQGVSGIELVRRFRAAAPAARVLVWSRQESPQTALTMIGAGAAGYLLKDDPSEVVIDAIRPGGRRSVVVSRRTAEAIVDLQASTHLRALEMEDAVAMRTHQLERTTTAKGEFLANVSHELRTPVTVAKGIAQVLKSHEVSDEERREFLGKLNDSLEKLMGIVDGILTIADADRGDLTLDIEELDLAPLVHVVADDVGRKYPQVRIDRAIQESLPARADIPRITDVIRHLLDNACRYSPPAGAVHVRTRSLEEGVVVSVTDEGEGILREVVARAFEEPFSTGEAILRKERAGAGLGLHMARKLVIEHGGVMWADPLPGGGTRVSFCLPAHSGETLTVPPEIGAEPIEPSREAVPARITVHPLGRSSASPLHEGAGQLTPPPGELV